MASAKIEAMLRPLLVERDRLIQQAGALYDQAEAISNRIAGLEIAIGLIERGGVPEQPMQEASQVASIKALLLDFAREVKGEGLNANIAVAMAAKRGIDLKRGTAASNLSRLKYAKALIHDGRRYRLSEFVRPQPALLQVVADKAS
jgi:hypothetical protein